MQMSDFLGLLGGLALFLYGMQMMSSGLEAAAGSRMKMILERLTANRFLGVLVGAAITAVIQSSSATTVMVVGFVNAGMMTLNQAVWIIMGANIGTTVTGLLIALDVGELAPLFAFVGVALVVFVKKPQLQHIGQILAGLGVLFIGMDMMSSAMSPLRESEAFINLMSTFSNPLLGILAGAGFTAVIQSSSASVGILQALANSGVIGLPSAVFVLFGQNIGTCITAVLASIGTSRSAKRATIIHLLFNVIGTVIFTLLFLIFPIAYVVDGSLTLPGALGQTIAGLMPASHAGQIALVHTSFNIITTIILLPLGNYLAKAAVKILPERPEDKADQLHLEYLTPIQISSKDGGLGVSAIYVDQMQHELRRMMEMAKDNVEASFRSVLNRDEEELEQVEKTEEYLDFLNKEISLHVSRLITYETNEKASAVVSSFFTISGNIERIGDHADNLAGYTRMLNKRNISFTGVAHDEISAMRDICLEGINDLLSLNAGNVEWLADVSALEQRIDDMTSDYRRNHLERMRDGECSDEACILYSELLTDFERIGDHILNIAQEMAKVQEHI
ncbi:MAG: Na/Pi cotransporter family protein [Flintibacter sp.]|uniref:Na/Pi cotransporter family protein n=1 Tax=Flintibacter TaxID=1918454 RepID=UPI002673F67B|nr:Na/Pi cotransporter family protein [Flintibacter sp.]MCI6150948.1 Na/Pi cotransporter family protein [Flintibacter sp.]MDD7115597.1 Na/Pi cotransporter family protein [Flintibacter sp.]MDY5037513.1 Na/Pi cotransporter family protein [Lawsonibacter sp.]